MFIRINSVQCSLKYSLLAQKHIMICKILNENKENIPEYEGIYYGNVEMKVKIAKHFLERIKTREKLKNMN